MKTSKEILEELKTTLPDADYLIVESAFKVHDEFLANQWNKILPTESELRKFALREQKKLKNAVNDLAPFIRIANLVCKVFKDKMINADGELPTKHELREFAIKEWGDWTGGDDRDVFCNIGQRLTDYIIEKRK